MKRILTLILIITVFSVGTFAQKSSDTASDDKSKKGGVVFKIPEDVFPMDWNKSGFRGILFLQKNSPSGIFIAYPNDDEKIEDLKARAVKFIAPMVIADDNGGKDFTLDKTPLAKREGDAAEAEYYSYANKSSMVQVLVYERTANEKNFIYGYFATRSKSDDPKKVKIWADENGQGVKLFEKFWKTIK